MGTTHEFGLVPIRTARDILPGSILTCADSADPTVFLVAARRKVRHFDLTDPGERLLKPTYVFTLVSSRGRVFEVEEGIIAVKNLALVNLGDDYKW